MGKASKWFRGLLLLGFKKQDSSSQSQSATTAFTTEKKKRWSFVKSYREKESHHQNFQNKLAIQRSVTGFALSMDNNENDNDDDDDDTTKHAIAVAEATKAVAEAAVAAAEAAAAVVRLTSSGRAITTTTTIATPTPVYVSRNCAAGYEDREIWAAIKIQSHFRAYLSRRALRALKALVRLQARFRGYIVRKDNANRLRRMQAMVRAQVRARAAAGSALNFESPLKSNQFNYSGPATPEKFEHMLRARSMKHGENLIYRSNGGMMNNYCKTRMGSNWIDSEMDIMRSWEQEVSSTRTTPNRRGDKKGDKILEVDNGKAQAVRRRRNLFHSCHLSLGSDQCSHSFTTPKESTAAAAHHPAGLSLSSCEVQSFTNPMKFCQDVDEEEEPYYAADDFYTASSKGRGGGTTNRGPFTPTKSDCSRSCQSGYSDYYPSYMAYTESSKAKMRSLSAPKQRPQYERSSPTKRYSIHGYGDSRTSTVQKVSSLHANFTNKIYPGSGRLDRLGMPVTEELISFSGGLWNHRC